MPDSYSWSVEGAPVRIELERDAARKLREAVSAANPEEIGGFLLGTVLAGVTRITGFQLVECEHRRGEAYDLTPLDRLRFSRRCSPWLNKRPNETRAVGFFRTHVRPGLFLDEHDFRTVQEFFADPSQVVLLVRPEPEGSPVAGFFFWEAGDMERSKSYRPFPLDEAAAQPLTPPAVETPRPAPIVVSAAAAAVTGAQAQDSKLPSVRGHAVTAVPPLPPARHADNEIGWKYGLIAACIPLVASLAYYAGRHQAPRAHAEAPPAAVAAAPTVAAPEPPPVVAPATEAAPNPAPGAAGNLSSAPVVARFPMAQKRSPMDTPSSLASGRARRVREEEEPDWGATLHSASNAPSSYHPAAYQTGQGLHGGVRVVTTRPDQPAAGSQPTATPEAAAPSETARLENRPAEMPEPEPTAPAPERPVARFHPELHPAITLEAEDPTSGLGHRLVRFPKRLLTLGRGRHDDFVPPRALHEVAPTVPPRVARELTDDVPITVRIAVDTEGRVRGTELVSGAADPQLADLALNAARKWEFAAARQNNMPVPSSVVAHFRFRPPQP